MRSLRRYMLKRLGLFTRGALPISSAVAIALCSILSAAPAAQQERAKTVPVSVGVESEGVSVLSEGFTTDITKPEILELERLIRNGLSNDKSMVVVKEDEQETHLHITIVAAHLKQQGGARSIVASSAVTLLNQHGDNSLGTHDVLVSDDLSSLAARIVFQVLSFKLRVSLGPFRR